jgi:hypothetical protein
MSALQEFMDELDYLMEKAVSIDVFQLPMDAIENLEVEPICSVFLMKAGKNATDYITS